MERPINVFWDFLKNLKDLVVSVKIGKAEATPYGVVLAQLNSSEFEVKDEDGNQGICKLVAKKIEDLKENEMSIWALCCKTVNFTFIKKIIDNIMIDFNNIKYSWELDHDSTQGYVLLRKI